MTSHSPEKFLDTSMVVIIAPCRRHKHLFSILSVLGKNKQRLRFESSINIDGVIINEADLQFSASVELAQTLYSLLAMHHGGNSRPLLSEIKA